MGHNGGGDAAEDGRGGGGGRGEEGEADGGEGVTLVYEEVRSGGETQTVRKGWGTGVAPLLYYYYYSCTSGRRRRRRERVRDV